jgi:hypothetical protein
VGFSACLLTIFPPLRGTLIPAVMLTGFREFPATVFAVEADTKAEEAAIEKVQPASGSKLRGTGHSRRKWASRLPCDD